MRVDRPEARGRYAGIEFGAAVGAARKGDGDAGEGQHARAGEVGAVQIQRGGVAPVGAAEAGGAGRRARAAGRGAVAAPDHWRARDLRGLDDREVVLPGPAGAPRPGGGAGAEGAPRQRDGARHRHEAGRDPGRAPSTASGVVVRASPRQPEDPRRARPDARAAAGVPHDRPIHEGDGPDQAEAQGAGRQPRRAPRGAPLRAPRGAQLRERVRGSAVAHGLPSRLGAGAARRGPVGASGPVRDPRRSFAPVLPRAVVLPGGRRVARPRADPGVSQARPAAQPDERQRLADDRRGDGGGAGAPGDRTRCRTRPTRTGSRRRGGARSRAVCSPCSRACPS
jgi:hypothetical protein